MVTLTATANQMPVGLETSGAILRITLEEQANRVVPGPNQLGESEVLLRGVIRGLPVELIP